MNRGFQVQNQHSFIYFESILVPTIDSTFMKKNYNVDITPWLLKQNHAHLYLLMPKLMFFQIKPGEKVESLVVVG